MTLGAPVHLMALLAIPLVAAAYAVAGKRRRRFAVRFPAAVYARAAGRPPQLRRLLPAALLAAAGTALAVALAKPQTTVAVPVEKASVMLVTDESGSMSANEVDPSRLAAAQSAAEKFLDRVPDKLLVGFVALSSQVDAAVEPTLEHDHVRTALQGLRADGGTATGDALDAALDRLAARRGKDGERAPAAVILLSDGKRTQGSDPLAAAQRAKQLGIPVSTVALGTADGTVLGPMGEPLAVPPDPATLQEISRITGGSAASPAARPRRQPTRASSTTSTSSWARRWEPSGSSARSAPVSRRRGWSCCWGGLATGLRWRGRLP
jgi:Ca-activated chloride channel family protein